MTEPSKNGDGYETKDVDTKAIFKFGVALVIGVTIAHLIILGLNFGFADRITESLGQASPLVKDSPREIPEDLDKMFPQPRLQVKDVEEMAEFKARQQAKLNGYGWIDEEKGVVHIPIKNAMNLLIERNRKSVEK